jgi:hypothetical protein
MGKGDGGEMDGRFFPDNRARMLFFSVCERCSMLLRISSMVGWYKMNDKNHARRMADQQYDVAKE